MHRRPCHRPTDRRPRRAAAGDRVRGKPGRRAGRPELAGTVPSRGRHLPG